jgi:uncharacterized membrane protein
MWIIWTITTIIATIIVAIIVNLIIVLRMPYNIMKITLKQRMNYPSNQWVFATPSTHRHRAVVRPSPDLLYSICCYDVSRQPVHLTAVVPDNYWSISGYAMNTDNFFVINDTQVKSNPIEVILTRKGTTYRDTTGEAHVITAPSDKGIVLIRTVITGKADSTRLVEIQKKSTAELAEYQPKTNA